MMDRLEAGELVVIDGATGTECERRGIPQLDGAWSGGAALSHPDIVRQIHRDYLEAGAELIIANTFGTHRHVLETAGVADDFVAYNRRGVELALEARAESSAHNAVVAAGMSNWTWKGEHPPRDVLARNSADQASVMADAGAELLILEMMIDTNRMRATLDGAMTVGLPIWVGFSCGPYEGGPTDDGVARLVDGELLSDGIDALDGYDIGAVFVMHTPVDLIDTCLDAALARWTGPLGVYAHSGDGVYSDWILGDGISPTTHQTMASGWIDRGVRIIGGCCGTTPEHIEALTALKRP